MRVRTILLGLFVVVFAFASLAPAQVEQGRLTGVVKDAQGGVVPGVTVTVTSPALIGQRTAVTEANGTYIFNSLPSGAYTAVYELQGFQRLERRNIQIVLAQTITVDVQLQLATIAETITVAAESPVVDVATTKVGADFTGKALVGVPTASDIWSALAQSPGVRMTGFDVGGSHKSQQTTYESFGIRGQNKVMFDGVDTTEGTSAASFYADYYATEEIAVSAVGGDVEMSTPGSAVLSTIKSGGNKFSGLEHFTYEPTKWISNNIDARKGARLPCLTGPCGFTGQPNLTFWETHVDLGGPIKRDRLWFYGSYNYFKIDKVISGVQQNVATDLGKLTAWVAKLTFKLDQKDTIIGYYQWGNKKKPFRGLSASVPPESVLAQDSDSWMRKAEWQRIWSNRLFMDIKASMCCYDWPMVPAVDYRTKPPRIDTDTSVLSGSGWGPGPFTLGREKPQSNGQITYYLPGKVGSHDLKFGYEYILDQSKYGLNGRSGPIRYLDNKGAVDEIYLTDLGDPATFGTKWKGSNDENTRLDFYAQDRWAPNNRLSITFGVRFDHQRPHYEAGLRDPVLKDAQIGFKVGPTPAAAVISRNNIAPRVGATVDLRGNGKSVLKGFYGRYYANYADSFSSVNPAGINTKTYKFLDQNGNRLYDGPQELGGLVATSGGSDTRVNPNMKQPYTDEISGSVEHQFWGESAVRVTYVRKKTHNTFGLVNAVRLGAVNVLTPLANPLYPQFSSTPTINALDIPSSLKGLTDNVYTTDLPNAEATYDTIQFAAQRRFSKSFFFQGGFDYQWRDEIRRPTPAPTTSPLNSDPISPFTVNGNSFSLDYGADIKNRQKNTNWQARVLGRYEFPYEIAFATNVRVQSGFAWAPIAVLRLPNAGTQRVFIDNLKNRRSDTVPIVDFRVDKSFRIAGSTKITGIFDIYNALNSNAVTNFFMTSGTTFQRIVATLDPRTIQVALRFEF